MLAIEAVNLIKYRREGKSIFTLGPLSLRISEGELILVTGGNGSGKSTLLSCLARVLQPDKGTVVWEDKIRPSDIVFMEQDYKSLCLPWFTVRENIEILRYAKNGASFSGLEIGWLEKYLPRILHDKLNTPAHVLSGGEAQAMVLSRVLLSNKKVILLDEPFSNLDTGTTLFFTDLLHCIGANRERLCVVVMHLPPDDFSYTSTFEMVSGKILCNKG